MQYFIIPLLLISLHSYGQTNKSFTRMDVLNLEYTESNDACVDSIHSYGIVVIKVIVNRDGKVISAEPVPDISTTKDTVLLKSAKDAALKAKFERDGNGVPKQIGFITYTFKKIKK